MDDMTSDKSRLYDVDPIGFMRQRKVRISNWYLRSEEDQNACEGEVH